MAIQESRRHLFRNIAIGAALLTPGAAALAASSFADGQSPVQTKEFASARSYLSPVVLNQKLGALEAQFPPSFTETPENSRTRIQSALDFLNDEYNKPGEPKGPEGYNPILQGGREYLAITDAGMKPFQNDSLVAYVGAVWPFAQVPDGKYYEPKGGWGLFRISVPFGHTISLPATGRVFRLNPETIANPYLNFSPDDILRQIASQTPNIYQRIESMTAFVNQKHAESKGKLGIKVPAGKHSEQLKQGQYIIVGDEPKITGENRLGTATFIPDFYRFDGANNIVYGVSRVSVLEGETVEITNKSRDTIAIPLAMEPLKKFVPVIVNG